MVTDSNGHKRRERESPRDHVRRAITESQPTLACRARSRYLTVGKDSRLPPPSRHTPSRKSPNCCSQFSTLLSQIRITEPFCDGPQTASFLPPFHRPVVWDFCTISRRQ